MGKIWESDHEYAKACTVTHDKVDSVHLSIRGGLNPPQISKYPQKHSQISKTKLKGGWSCNIFLKIYCI